MRAPLAPPTLEEIRSARERIRDFAVRTPVVRVPEDLAVNGWLKLENLQPIGSFKIRGAANAMALAERSTLRHGVYTASAGNMAQGVAWCARSRGLSCNVIVPEHAPLAKTDAIQRLGATVIRVPFEIWWRTLIDHGYPGMPGLFIHPFADPAVLAGNATISLEIVEELGTVDAVLVPYGGGGLVTGIAAGMRAVSPATKVFAVESDTAAPLTASLAAGKPVTIEMTRTFIDGMGSNTVLEEMWPLVSTLVDGTRVVRVDQVAHAVRVMITRMRVVAEGAGAAGLAAAMCDPDSMQRTVAIVSGGNIDEVRLRSILNGEITLSTCGSVPTG